MKKTQNGAGYSAGRGRRPADRFRVSISRRLSPKWRRRHGREINSRDRGDAYSAGCSTTRRFGASQKRSGRSNRKHSGVLRVSQNNISGPSTPAPVTITDISPISGTSPVLSRKTRVAAMNRKKAR